MSTIYTQYVEREPDLSPWVGSFNNNAADQEAQQRGWDRYYRGSGGSDIGHKAFIDNVWSQLPKNEGTEANPTKFSKQWYMNKVSEPGSTWIANSVPDQTGDAKGNAIKAARRMLARDYHRGQYAFAPGNPAYDLMPKVGGIPRPGKDRGFATFSIKKVTSAATGKELVKTITLNANENDFYNNDVKNDVYNTVGYFHWENDGKNEARALPGNPFIYDPKSKTLSINTETVGKGLITNPDGSPGAYSNILTGFQNASKGDYKGLVENALAVGQFGGTKDYLSDFIDYNKSGNLTGGLGALNTYYQENKVPVRAKDAYVQPPSFKLGKKFDAAYYGTETTHGIAALERWNNSQNSVAGFLPDLDVVGIYTPESIGLYLHNVYSELKESGIADKDNRGNREEETVESDNYFENWNKLSDAEQQAFRDDLLGLTQGTASGGVTVDWTEPFITDEEGNIVYETDEFGNQTPVINPEGISFLESSVFNVFGKKDLEQQDRFQALALDVLKTSVDKLNAERKREQELNIYKGLPGFNEIYGANSTIANSIIGDSGIGGYLSMAGVNVDRLTESLEDQLSGATGISNNSSVYNWQKWFNETLLDRYENIQEITGQLGADVEGLDPILDTSEWNKFEKKINKLDPETQPEKWNKFMDKHGLARGLSKERALEIKDPNNWKALLEKYNLDTNLNKEEAVELLTNSENEINRIYTIEDEFRNKFIDEYIKPRFDQSKSMDEFISYLDTLDEDEQNVFQTQDAMTALKNVASAHAAAKLSQIQAMPHQKFDYEFYFDPTTAIDPREGFEGPKDNNYRKQAERVQADYAAALANPDAIIEGTEDINGGITWNQYAYYYGVDLKDKEQFSRLHYDAIGKNLAYDPAKDVTSVADIKGYIVDTVIPKVSEAKLDLGDASFSQFTTPEEFADHLLEGIDPTENNPEWKEILDQFGLDIETSLDELKEYIIDITRTGAAKDIRESIKFLNEKKLKPTQERLGVTYIERDEDAKDIEPENQSSLYQIFADAGYAGTEDEFFTDFMPDADRGDIEMITQALPGGTGFNLSEISSDPFTAMSQIGSFMGSTDSDIFGSGDQDRDSDEDPAEDYFSLFGDDEKEDYYSDAGRDYISEYTTFFK